MSRYNKPVTITWHNVLIQALVVIAAIAIIVLTLPRDGRSRMNIDVGRPWPYSQFIAPFDFAIFKSEAQLQYERDSIRKLYKPYFEPIPFVMEEQVEHFRADYRNPANINLSPAYRFYIEQNLRAVYARGIVSTEDYQMLVQDSCLQVHIIHDNTAELCLTSRLLSQKSAYEALLAGADSTRINRQELQRLNLNRYVRPNLALNANKSREQREELLKSLSPSSGMVLAGQSIIDRGEIVSEQDYLILQSYERAVAARAKSRTGANLGILGQICYVGIILICLLFYFNLFRRDYIGNLRCVTLLISLVLTFTLLTAFFVYHSLFTVYLIPYAVLPVFIRIFMDSRTAFITHACTIFLCALSLRYPFEFITTQCVAGLVAIYTLRELSERSQLFRSTLFVTTATLLFYLSIDLLHGRQPLGEDSLTQLDWTIYKHIILSGLLFLFAYPLMFALEKLFGFTSTVTLVELSNINRDLLRRMSEEAPGTFQHSMQVANLAAEVARKIGANSQLVRTGALYHDIGKMQNPAFFTENQLGGINPHNKLDPRESARIIINHVREGEQMADRAQLPKAIRDFISTHHGHGLAKYFYITYKNQHPNVEVDQEPFTYPGRNPSTMEQAILMMADAVEASARSLKTYDDESIAQLVDNIIDGQMQAGYFTECPLTFLDIKTAKDVFKEKLKTIYHTRVSYPTINTDKKEEKKGK